MRQLLVGQILHGFCGGVFGRDSYDDKRVEAVGEDWVVVRDSTGIPLMGYLRGGLVGHEQLIQDSESWEKERE